MNKGAGPWLLWPPLTPSPRCWGPRASPLLTGLVSVTLEPGGEGGDLGRGDPQGQARYGGVESYYLQVFHTLPALPVDWSVGVCSRRDMRLSWVLTVLSICLSALATAAGAEGKRKLQIGVKKRVDHCPIKSRKGDVLHMHYTVGEEAELLGVGGDSRDQKGLGSQVPLLRWVTLGKSLLPSASFHGSIVLFTVYSPGWHQQRITMYCELPKALSPSRTMATNSVGGTA